MKLNPQGEAFSRQPIAVRKKRQKSNSAGRPTLDNETPIRQSVTLAENGSLNADRGLQA
jgi:hypothetical protein